MNKSLDIKDWYVSNFGEFEKRLNGEIGRAHV